MCGVLGRLVVGMVAAVLVMGCRPTSPEVESAPDATDRRIQVVASFLPVYAHTARVAGDRAVVRMLLKSDSGPHDYQLSPDDVKSIADADLFVIHGAGIEAWLDDLVRAAGRPGLTVVDSSAGLERMEGPAAVAVSGLGKGGAHVHGEHDHDHHHGEGGNPHLWLDPVLAIAQTRNITNALIAADPAHEADYRRNAEVYIAELEQLHREFESTLAKLPNRDLITFHDAFPYLARRYGMNYVGYIEAFPEKDPTPAQLKALVTAIRKHRVGVLFAEVGYAPAILKSLAEQTGARVAELDTLEVGEADPGAYLSRMRANLRALQSAWQ